MTIDYPPPLPPESVGTKPKPMPNPAGSGEDQQDTKDVAKQQATSVGQGAAEAGQHVAGVAKEQAGQVTAEAGRQAKELLGQAQSQLKEQAGAQQENLIAGLKSLSDELKSMSTNADNPGPASDVARQASERTSAAASWLDGKEPAEILDEVTAFARQRPGMFLALAAGVGLLAGRLTRGLKAQSASSATDPVGPSTTPPTPMPAFVPPVAPAPVVPAVGVTDPLKPSPAGAFETPDIWGDAAMSMPYDPNPTGYDSRSSASVGELLADVSRDFSTLMRQEVELAKAELKESATKAGKGAGMFAGAGLGGHMVMLFLSIALWWGLGDATGHAISALIVAVVWAVIAAVLALLGRKELKTMTGLSRTTESVGKIPPAVKGEA